MKVVESCLASDERGQEHSGKYISKKKCYNERTKTCNSTSLTKFSRIHYAYL